MHNHRQPALLAPLDYQTELAKIRPVTSVDATSITTSYNKLHDREFEMLSAELFKAGDAPVPGLSYDAVQLLPTGVDEGRDVVLLLQERPVAALQCKLHADPLGLPEVLAEMARFVLAAKLRNHLLPDSRAFTYVLAAPRGVTKPAQALFFEKARVLREEQARLEEATLAVLKKYKSFAEIEHANAVEHVRSVLTHLTLRLLTAADLDPWLVTKPKVYSTFFTTRLVVDSGSVTSAMASIRTELVGHAEKDRKIALQRWAQSGASAVMAVVSPARNAGRAQPIVLDDVYVHRTIETGIADWFGRGEPAGARVLVCLVAPGGYGKTSLLWHCHRSWVEAPGSAAWLIGSSTILSLIAQGVFDESLAALVDEIRLNSDAGTRVLVCIDTLDVLAHEEPTLLAALRMITEMLAAGAGVLVTTRPEEFARMPLLELASLSTVLYVQEYDQREFADAIGTHCRAFYRNSGRAASHIEEQIVRLQNLVALGRPAKEVCLNPLTLRMLFELYAPDEIPEDINSFRLYTEYWIARVVSDRRNPGQLGTSGRNLSEPAHFVAGEMLRAGAPFLGGDQLSAFIAAGKLLESDVADLVSRNLLARSEAGNVEFFHQTFFEHAAARHLASPAAPSVGDCVARIRACADDGFRLPVHEQLFLLLAATSPPRDTSLEEGIDTLLSDTHPGVQGVGLHAHLLSPSGYESGRRFLQAAGAAGDAYVLKRLCQLIYNLRRERASEVAGLIAASWPAKEWNVLELLARCFVWVAQADWRLCRSTLAERDLLTELRRKAPNAMVDVETWLVAMLENGVDTDGVWVVQQALRCVRNKRHPRLVLEFLARSAPRLSQEAARLAVSGVVRKVTSAPKSFDEAHIDDVAGCIAAIWDAHPALAPAAADRVPVEDNVESTLVLRSIAGTASTALETVKESLLRRIAVEEEPGVLYALLHRFAVPVLVSGGESPALREKALGAWELLLDRMLGVAATVRRERAVNEVVASATKELYARGADAARLWALLLPVTSLQWLASEAYLHLFPIALAENAPGARCAFEEVCKHPAAHPAYASILKGALPSLPARERLFGTVLQLARATGDAQLLYAFFDKAKASADWANLVSMATPNAADIERICRDGLSSASPAMRTSAYLLYATLHRSAVVRASYQDALAWHAKERQKNIRSAAMALLQAATSAAEAERTTEILLDGIDSTNRSAFNQIVEGLRSVLAIPGIRLPRETQDRVLRFALQAGAIEPQVSLAGRLIEQCCINGDLEAAQQVALATLRSETVRNLSATQKRSLGHRLDKPMLALYRQLPADLLHLHIDLLPGMDRYLGRIVVTSLCKSERADLDELLGRVMAEPVDPELRRIIQDYRQILWKR